MRKIYSAVLMLALLLNAVPAFSLKNTSSDNLAQGKPVWASSEFDSAAFQSPKLVDGDINTGWSSAGTPPHWFAVDLGEAYTITEVELVTRQDYDQPETRQGFEVRASNDRSFASYAVLGRCGMDGVPYKGSFTAKTADETPYRYIQVIKTDSLYFFMSEIMVYGREASAQSGLKPPPGYKDMTESGSAEAAELLSVLDIMGGSEDKVFKPEKLMTRAEAAQTVCAFLNAGTIAAKGKFADVPVGYSAAAAIETLSARGIINGTENGLFYPEERLTGMELVKMLVCALGYEAQAERSGGYPAGFLSVAGRIGLDADYAALKKPIDREQAARLVYSALLCSPAENTGIIGDSLQMEVKRSSTALYENFKAVREKGRVTAVGETDLIKGDCLPKGQLKIDDCLYESAQANLLELLGREVSFYYRENIGGNNEALLISPKGRYETLTVLSKDIIPTGDPGTFSYYENGNKKTVSLVRGAEIIYNGRLDNSADASVFDNINGEVRLAEMGGGYGTVFIYDYEVISADRVTSSGGEVTVYNKLGSPITLKTDSPGYYTSFQNESGAEISPKAIEEADVLMWAKSRDSRVNRLIATDRTISGRIDSIRYDENAAGRLPEYISVEGVEYEVISSCVEAIKNKAYGVFAPAAGDLAVLHLDIYNRVADITKGDTAGGAAYGYLAGAELKRGVGGQATLLLFTDKMEQISCSESVLADGSKTDGAGLIALLEKTATNGSIGQLIRFQRGNDGLIRSVYTTGDTASDYNLSKDVAVIERYYVQTVNAFYAVDGSVKHFFSDESTVFFEVPEYLDQTAEVMTDGNYYKRCSLDEIVNYKHYYAEGYSLNEAQSAAAVILYNKSPLATDGAEKDTYGPLIIVDELADAVGDGGESIKRLYGYRDGKRVGYDIYEKLDTAAVKLTRADGTVTKQALKRGDVIRVSLDKNTVVSMVMIFNRSEPMSLQNGKNWDDTSIYPAYCRVTAGVITKALGAYAEFAVGEPAADTAALEKEVYRYTDANVMLYERDKDKLSVIEAPEIQKYLYAADASVRYFARTSLGVLQTVLILK